MDRLRTTEYRGNPTDTSDLKHYFSNELGWGWGVQQEIVFEFLMKAADASKGGVLLDAGAGHQRYKPFFVDCLYLAQEHPEAGKKNKRISQFDILCDVKYIPLESNVVDSVLSTSSLEHFESPEQFFSEAYRVLKPGGSLFINVPFMYPEHEIPYDFQRPTRYGLQRWYSHAGFDAVIVRPTSSSIYTATAFIGDAILEDLGGLRKALSEDYLTGIRFALEKSYFKKYLLYFLLGKPIMKLLPMLLDSIPDEQTRFPIGWVAIGKKPGGQSERRGCGGLSRLEFLEKNIVKDNRYVLSDGVILAS